MVKTHSNKRKTRSDNFPLTLHPTGQFCKKIMGKLYYFGTDKQEALQRYLEQATFLHSGKSPISSSANSRISLKPLCNLYLTHQESRVATGEIKLRQLHDQTRLLRHFAKYVGPNRSIGDISTIDLQNYRARLVRAGKAAATINNHISAIKAMYHWAEENEIISSLPNLKAIKKIAKQNEHRPTFSVEHIETLLANSGPQMNAMIWLGLNCGFGCTDCSELQWKHINLDAGRVNYPRSKTGVARNLPLWKETIEALKTIPKVDQYLFRTRRGNKLVRVVEKPSKGGMTRLISYNNVSKEFSKLLKKTGIKTEKGVGFYTLRRTAATLAAKSGDPFAVQRLLGHADLKMATTYVQDVSEQTDRVINNSRKLICQDDS